MSGHAAHELHAHAPLPYSHRLVATGSSQLCLCPRPISRPLLTPGSAPPARAAAGWTANQTSAPRRFGNPMSCPIARPAPAGQKRLGCWPITKTAERSALAALSWRRSCGLANHKRVRHRLRLAFPLPSWLRHCLNTMPSPCGGPQVLLRATRRRKPWCGRDTLPFPVLPLTSFQRLMPLGSMLQGGGGGGGGWQEAARSSHGSAGSSR